MVRLLSIILLLLLASPAWAFPPLIAGKTAGAAAASCNPANNEVGDRGSYSSDAAIVANECVAHIYTADCSGTLGTGTVTVGSGGAPIKICVYTDSGDGVPNDAGDALVGCTDEITAAVAGTYTSSAKISQAVTSGSSYWLVVISKQSTARVKYGAGTGAVYYGSCGAGSYASPPANLGGLSLGNVADSGQAAFVTIE